MSIELQEGQVIKNYKELCNIMNWNISSGKTRTHQLKKLSDICDYHKEGNKYIIDKVHTLVNQIDLDSGKFIKDIELLILNMLANAEGRQVQLTTKKLYEQLALVNHNYVNSYSYVNNYKALENKLKIDQQIITDVFCIINNKNRRNVTRALKSLSDRALIICEQVMCVCYYDDYIKADVYRQATKGEKELILTTEREVMEKMGIKKKTYFNIPDNRWQKKAFNEDVRILLKENDPNINFYYYSYLITYNQDDIIETLDRVKEAQIKDRLNNKSLNSVSNQIDNNGTKTKEKYKNIIGRPHFDTEEEKARYSKSYEKKAKRVAKAVIDRKTRIKLEEETTEDNQETTEDIIK